VDVDDRAERAKALGLGLRKRMWPLPEIVDAIGRMRWGIVAAFIAAWMVGVVDLGWLGFLVCLGGLTVLPEILSGVYGALGGFILGRQLRERP
jgi:hypothetical protein